MSSRSSPFSSKWTSDLPMSPRSKRRNPIPFDPSVPQLQVQLPAPVTQALSSPRNASCFRAVADKWTGFKAYMKRTLAAPYVPSSSAFVENEVADVSPTAKKDELRFNDTDEVDEVVVDRLWSDDNFETDSDSDAAETASSRHGDQSDTQVDPLDVPLEGVWAYPPLAFCRTQIWPRIQKFYMPRFEDADEERLFQKEVWGQGKRPSLWASVFFVANCIIGLTTIEEPIVLADKIFYYGISPFLSIPIIFMCAYDWPYDRPVFFQTWLCVLTWSWPFYDTLFAYLCGFYSTSSHPTHNLFTCGTKDFLATFYYTSALQAVALFGMSLKRLPATIGALAFLILSCVTIVPQRNDYVHNVFNFVIFEFVLLYMHSQKEMSSRKLFWLRTQLKVQFQRTRKAQMAERQAADSKRRLTSYVFHEVRVPLNTALLAVQNMAVRPIAKDHEVEFNALEGSLSMMSKVLNDVLDFNRMDSGRLESLSRPYAFHKVLRSLFIPVRLAADARKLEFVTDLDMRIDEVARRAAYQYMEASPEAIAQHLLDQPSGEAVMGMVVGDETRLRQIITNLASNACKFTPAGGKLTIATRLVIPGPSACNTTSTGTPKLGSSLPSELTATALSLHNEPDAKDKDCALERIVVRIEVRDTGSGIPPKDMVECKLFSAFNQTEQGRQQGGKGTGLGLALVRQIVKLSGGRLGLHSKVGMGSTFWVEIPLGVGRKAMAPCTPGTPPSDIHSNVAPTFPVPGRPTHGQHPGSPGSGSTVAELVDAVAIAASQPPPPTTRSTSALHGLMDQGGRFELTLAKYDSQSPVPTRTLGDSLPLSVSPPPEPEPVPTPGQVPEPEPEPGTLEQIKILEPPRPPSRDSREDLDQTVRAARPTYVQLPAPRSFVMDATLATPSPPPGGTPPVGLRVLVVDDDALTRMLMARMLERMGCHVTTAENGEVALQKIVGSVSPAPSATSIGSGTGAGTEPLGSVGELDTPTEPRFAVIFLDNQMPKLSGVKLVERLRSLGRTDFVVGVTGNALLTDQKEYLDAGADYVLTKPVLEASLKSMLGLADTRKKALHSEAAS
ncbi:histidine kinase [Mycena sanguinolenta]|nr:histidine kinase [Mycena sanguinolenta]